MNMLKIVTGAGFEIVAKLRDNDRICPVTLEVRRKDGYDPIIANLCQRDAARLARAMTQSVADPLKVPVENREELSCAGVAEERFWLVWNPASPHSPKFRHASYAKAAAEAKRLAEQNPQHRFYVMEARGFAERPRDAVYAELGAPAAPF